MTQINLTTNIEKRQAQKSTVWIQLLFKKFKILLN